MDALARASALPLWRFLGKRKPRSSGRTPRSPFATPARPRDEAGPPMPPGFADSRFRVGGPDADLDVARVTAVRTAAPQASLILDANGGWTTSDAIAMAQRLRPLGIAWLEQPIAPGDEPGLREVCSRGGLHVVADESVHTAEDLQRLIAAEAVDGVHLKREMRNDCRVRRAAEVARNAGLLVEIGLMDQGRLGAPLSRPSRQRSRPMPMRCGVSSASPKTWLRGLISGQGESS